MMVKDPVCGMEVRDERWTTVYEEREYAFCSEGCRALFLQDPAGRLSREGEKKHYDMVIIGGGPAGLTAAVYASLQHLHALLLAKDLGGQAVDTTRIKNYMGYELITGPELLGKFKDQLLTQKYIEHRLDEVLRVEQTQDGFSLQTRNGSHYELPVVIVTTGDVSDGYGKRIIVAAGEGARAALAAGAYVRARTAHYKGR